MNNLEVHMIVAYDKDFGIGSFGGLAWNYKADLKHFQEETMGNVIIVGHETYKKLPVLKDRPTIVITSNVNNVTLRTPFHYAVNNAESAIALAMRISKTQKVYVIGGAKVYDLFKPYYTHVVSTFIDRSHEDIDTYVNMQDIDMSLYDSKVLVPELVYVNYYKVNRVD